MFNVFKKNIKYIAATLLTIFSLAGVVFGTFSWFDIVQTNSQYNVKGSSAGAYFAYGNGSSEHPFGISSPRHLYNLSWLQYMGKFSDDQYYFELADSVPSTGLNMNGYVLPPIGTEENPFVGNFNGNGKIIKNLTVSNDEDEIFSSNKHPDITQVNYEEPEIVGLFGVVGNLDDAYEGSYTSSVNTIYDLGITNFTINTTTAKTLVGVAAGYVDAEISNVAVNESSIEVKGTNTKCFDSSLTTNLTDYTAIGYCTDDYIGKVSNAENTLYGVDISTNEFSANDLGDGGVGAGGTIKMTEMYQRVVKIKNTQSTTTNTIKKTILYDKEDGSGNTPIKSSTDNTTSNSFRNYHSAGYETGNYTFAYRNTDSYNYIAGGHWEEATYIDDYYVHEGYLISTTVNATTNYLGASSTTLSNNIALSNKTVANQSLVWDLFNGDSGKISTTYNGTRYYIEVYNTTNLRITNSAASGTTFTKAVSNGKTRYSYNNYYLGFESGNWKMIPIPTEPPYSPPSILPNPGTWAEYLAANGVSYVDGDYQIKFVINGETKYLSYSGSTITLSDKPISRSWDIGSNYIRNTDTTARSISQSNNSTATLVTSNAQEWTITSNGSTRTFRYETGGCNSQTYYLKYTNSGLTIATGQNGNYQFTVANAQNEIDSYNESTLYSEWEDAVDDYNDSVTAYNNYDDITYPGLISDYETALAASYNLTFIERSVSLGNAIIGPDYYLDDSKTFSGMRYDKDDTSYFPLNVVKDGTQDDFTNYYPRGSNTGYLVGGSSYTSSTSGSADMYSLANIRISSYGIDNISKSYSTSSKDFTVTNGTKNIYTLNANYEYVKANDTLYENFSSNLAKLKETLNADNSNVYGLHFMSASIDKDAYVVAPSVTLNTKNTPYTNYKLPANSINFNLIQIGYINFFAGMYFSSQGGNNSFFSLHQVKRDANKDIVDIKEIENVYSDGIDGHSYIYQFTDGKFSEAYQYNTDGSKVRLDLNAYTEKLDETSLPTSYILPTAPGLGAHSCTYTSVFNTQRITNHWYSAGSFGGNSHAKGDIVNSNLTYNGSTTVDGDSVATNKSIFYFEIPMNDGEFCLGSVDGGTGGYLFYLDIGANAKKINRTTFIYHQTLLERFSSYPKGIAFTTVSNNFSVSDGDGAFVCIYEDYKDKATIRETSDGVFVVAGFDDDYIIGKYKNDGIDLKSGASPPSGTDIEIEYQVQTTEVWAIDYFDLDAVKNEVFHSVFIRTDVTIDETTTSTTVRKQYQNNVLIYDSTDVGINDKELATFYNDSGSKIDITSIDAPSSGVDAEEAIMLYSYFIGDVTIGDINIEITASRNGVSTYFTATGFVITIEVANNEETLTIVTEILDDLSAKYENMVVTPSGHYVLTITGLAVAP